MDPTKTNTKSQRAKKTSDLKSPKDIGQLTRQMHFQLLGDDAVLTLLRAHVSKQTEIKSDGVYVVASSAGLLIVTRELKDGKYLPYNDGTKLGLIAYADMADVIIEMERVYADFMSWRKALSIEDPVTASRTMQELNSLQYKRANNTLIFYTLVRVLAKTNRIIEAEELTPFYCGYNSSNIKNGEWFDRSTFTMFDNLSPQRPQNLFRMITLEHEKKYKVITAFSNISNTNHLHKFNMSAARVVFGMFENAVITLYFFSCSA
uniref:Uncharacterized protein n=1 Tax=Sururuca spinareovirus TaxID=3078416 RepID=A0AB38Z316_9REOV